LPKEKIVVLAPKSSGSDEFDNGQSYRIYRKKFFSTSPLIWPKWLHLFLIVREIIKREGIQQILVGQILPIGSVALFFKWVLKIPFVLSTHAMDIIMLKNYRRKTWLARRIIKHARKIITVSEFTFQALLRLGADKQKLSIITPATNIYSEPAPDKQTEIRKRYGLEGKKILLTIGRLVKRKGHLEVLKSLPEILEKYPNLAYLVGSDGPEKQSLKEYVEKFNLGNYVFFTGEIRKEELPSFYRIADIFIMPTLELDDGDVEGFGIVYLEANAFAKPVIASKSGGTANAVIDNKTGLLVNPLNPGEIALAVRKLLDDQNLSAKLGKQGQERVFHNFTWEKQSDLLINALS